MNQIDLGEEKGGTVHQCALEFPPYTCLQSLLRESEMCSGNPMATVNLSTHL